jgi:hypothetical protein
MSSFTLRDDLLEPARHCASAYNLPLEEAVSRLIGLGLARVAADELPLHAQGPASRFVDGFVEFAAPAGTPALSTEELLRIEDEY